MLNVEWHNSYFAMDIDSFTKDKIIVPFYRGSQFGGLYFSPEDDIDSVPEEYLELLPRYNSWLHGEKELFPDSSHYNSFILARLSKKMQPGQQRWVHIEEKLVSKYPDLLEASREYYGTEPKRAILYTMRSPCADCTALIMKTYLEYKDTIKMSVVYSTDYSKNSRKCNEMLRDIMVATGIDVVHVEDHPHPVVHVPVYF